MQDIKRTKAYPQRSNQEIGPDTDGRKVDTGCWATDKFHLIPTCARAFTWSFNETLVVGVCKREGFFCGLTEYTTDGRDDQVRGPPGAFIIILFLKNRRFPPSLPMQRRRHAQWTSVFLSYPLDLRRRYSCTVPVPWHGVRVTLRTSIVPDRHHLSESANPAIVFPSPPWPANSRGQGVWLTDAKPTINSYRA